MPNYVVIGSNCFTGSHIVDALLREPDNRVIGVSRSPEPRDLFLPYRGNEDNRFTFRQIDIVRNFQEIMSLLDEERPSYVINVAALSEVALSNHSPIEYYRINTLAVAQLVDHLRKADWLRRYIHISSAEIYGSCETAINESQLFNPSTPYAVSKAAGDMHIESAVRQFDFPALVVRSTNVFGAHQQLFKIIPRTAIYARQGRKLQLHGGGTSMKSFVHVEDVVRGMIQAIDADKTGVFHFSVASETSVADVVRLVCDYSNVKFDEAVESVGERLGQDQRYWLDCSKAAEELGWSAQISLEEGIAQTVEWIQIHWDQIQTLPLEYEHRV